MQKALLALRGFRRAALFRQAIDDPSRDLDGVFHLALGIAGMGADAFDGDHGTVGRERLVLDMPRGFAVDRIGKIRAELAEIGLVDAAADLFVGCEQDLDRAVLDVGMADQEMRGIDDFGKARLVVGAEQGGAVGGDDVIADLIGEGGMLGGADDLAGIARQHDVAAAIVADNLRLDVPAGTVGRGVHVRAETDDRHPLGGIGGNGRINVAVLVEMGVAKTDRLQFRREQAAQILLLVGGRTGR